MTAFIYAAIVGGFITATLYYANFKVGRKQNESLLVTQNHADTFNLNNKKVT